MVVAAFACTPGLAAGAAVAADLKVVATVKPIHAIAAAVMAGAGEPRLLIDGSASPHTYTLKPSDAKLVNDAQVFFRVSERLETFTGKLVKALPKSVQVVTLENAPGVTLLPLRDGGAFEAHTDAKAKGHQHGHGHDHAATAKSKVGTSEGMDGHIWLDPGNARALAGTIAEVLAAARPDQADLFKRNAANLWKRIDELDTELAATLKPEAGKTYVVFHDAYQYW